MGGVFPPIGDNATCGISITSVAFRGDALMHSNPQQRACCKDIIAVAVILRKVFETLQRRWNLLYFVEDDQGILWRNGYITFYSESAENPGNSQFTNAIQNSTNHVWQ